MPQVVMIADDLTGAADTGVAFARNGLIVMVALDPDHLPSADVVVVSTESRSLSRDEATERVSQAAHLFGNLDRESWIYKKIDSTLRGHPGPELLAVMRALNHDRALVAPAFPAQGRTTVAGKQLVSGQLVEETPSGAEVGESDLRDIMNSGEAGPEIRLIDLDTVRSGPAMICSYLGGSGQVILIADAETDEDLAAVVVWAAQAGIRLLCGSAGLAHALADRLPGTSYAAPPDLPEAPVAPVLVVAGSPHPSTARQVDRIQMRGEMIARVDHAFLNVDGSIKTVIDAIALGMNGGRNVVLTTSGLNDVHDLDHSVADRLGEIVHGLATDSQLGGLVLTGGDVAAAVCRALGATAIWLRGEVQPGIPWGQLVGGALPGLPVVTKSGGFGGADALVSAIAHLTAGR